MNILMLNYEYPPIGGGTGNACFYLLKEFGKRTDINFTLVTFSPDGATRKVQLYPNVAVHYVDCGRKGSMHHWTSAELLRWLIYTFLYLRRHVSFENYDLVHCWSGWPAGILGYAYRRRCPYIVALRGSDVPGHTPRTELMDKLILRKLSAKIWRAAAAVTSVSKYLAELASRTAKLPFIIINNGVNSDEFYPAEQSCGDRPLQIIYVGRLSPHKGVDDLLEALVILQDRLPGELSKWLQLTIVGSGAMEDELRTFVSDRNLTDAVHFKGVLPHSEIPDLLRQQDVLVFPCHSDAMANVILEAIASGLAILSTRTGGSEVISDNGLLVNTRDPADIAEKLLFLIHNSEAVVQFKYRSAELSGRLGWDSCCASYEALYRQVLAGSSHETSTLRV